MAKATIGMRHECEASTMDKVLLFMLIFPADEADRTSRSR
jgi:hypothetical protein